jgi:hypothetical protein
VIGYESARGATGQMELHLLRIPMNKHLDMDITLERTGLTAFYSAAIFASAYLDAAVIGGTDNGAETSASTQSI